MALWVRPNKVDLGYSDGTLFATSVFWSYGNLAESGSESTVELMAKHGWSLIAPSETTKWNS